MGRNLIPTYGLLVAISLACQPARAGDRKSPHGFRSRKSKSWSRRRIRPPLHDTS
jgi:hypothetical protein